MNKRLESEEFQLLKLILKVLTYCTEKNTKIAFSNLLDNHNAAF